MTWRGMGPARLFISKKGYKVTSGQSKQVTGSESKRERESERERERERERESCVWVCVCVYVCVHI